MGEYLQKKENVFISNIEKAKHLSRFLRLQLPTAWTDLDFTSTITQKNVSVNPQNEKSARASPEIVKDVRRSGFQKSVYGKEELIIYLQKHKQQDTHVVDNKRAKQLSPSIGLQLPQPPIALDYNKTITDFEQHVNPQNEKRSLFGREHIKFYFEKYENWIWIDDKERAKQIFRVAEHQ